MSLGTQAESEDCCCSLKTSYGVSVLSSNAGSHCSDQASDSRRVGRAKSSHSAATYAGC